MFEDDSSINIEDNTEDQSKDNTLNNRNLSIKDRSKFFTHFGLWMTILYSSSFEVIGALIGTMILSIAVTVNFLQIHPDGTYDPNSSHALILLLITNLIATIVVGGTALFLNRKIGFTSKKQMIKIVQNDLKFLVFGFSVMLFVVAGLEALISFIQERFYPDFYVVTPYDFFKSDNLVVILIAVISVSIFAPIVEEIFFRWIIIDTFRGGRNKYATIIFSSLIFAFAHSAANLSYSFYFFIIHLITTFIIGLIFGIIYYKTRKIILTIILHAVWNLVISLSAIFEFFNLGAIYNIIYLILIGLGAFGTIFGIVFYFRSKEKRGNFIKNLNSKKTKIKIKSEWFVLILVYFSLIVIIPVILQNLLEYFSFGEGFIVLIYLGLLMFVSSFLVSKKYSDYWKLSSKIDTEQSREILEIQLNRDEK
ncbi:MAG TPA: CPBP family intramembrane glutamic endopeptidase [candidate division Zixibacteria bacterium]|nr:CPBP family intramembrane glutamic endopeptidase [candidate division Zixibacteria bacterium]